MAYKIAFSLAAENDLDGILDWLVEQQAGLAGLRWFEGLESAVMTLSSMPERCPRVKRDARVPFEARVLLYGKKPHTIRVMFRVIGDTVSIIRIRRARQDAVSLH